MLRFSSSEPLSLQRNSLKNTSDPTKSLLSLVLYHSLSSFQSLCALFIQFSMCPYSNPPYPTLSPRVSDAVHTGVEVCRMDSEMSGLVDRPWFQLMCCAICLPRSRNFRWRRESPSGSEYWLVCRCWTPEIEFNESLSLSSIIRLANYSVTTSLIYKWKV